VDGVLQMQAAGDADYFTSVVPRKLDKRGSQALRESLLAAYRWQYIVSGVTLPRFQKALYGMITPEQKARIGAALALIMA